MMWYIPLVLGISWAAYSLLPNKMQTGIQHVELGRHNEAQPYPPLNEVDISVRPHHKGMTKLQDLPSKHVPEIGKHRHGGRLVVVGDVHGMKAPLLHLLSKIDFDRKHDHLILAGDMISKGPDSAGVIDLAMKLGATGVRGNHEDRTILTYTNMIAAGLEVEELGMNETAAEDAVDSAEMDAASGSYKDRKLVKVLGKKRINWLKSCPVILRVGYLEGMGNLVVVHAGLVPGVKMEKQNPESVMNMRTIDKHGRPSSDHDGQAWRKVH